MSESRILRWKQNAVARPLQRLLSPRRSHATMGSVKRPRFELGSRTATASLACPGPSRTRPNGKRAAAPMRKLFDPADFREIIECVFIPVVFVQHCDHDWAPRFDFCSLGNLRAGCRCLFHDAN